MSLRPEFAGDAEDLALGISLLALEADVIALEVAGGWSVPGATRMLHPWEAAAHVRFGALEDAIAAAAARLRKIHDDAFAPYAAALLEAVRLADPQSGAQVLAALTGLRRSSNARLDLIVATAEDQLMAALGPVHAQGAAAVLTEAAAQGVLDGVPGPPAVPISTAAADALEQVVYAAAATHPRVAVQAAIAAAQPYAADTTTPVATILDAVQRTVDGLAYAEVDDQINQVATAALNAGREDATRVIPAPKEVYSSELLDKRTCGPCAEADGRQYGSVEAAKVDYPGGGGYVHCDGGARCRGTLVYVWPTEATPSRQGLARPGDEPGTRPAPGLPETG